ncbi:MAG: hypothetical protein IPO90_12245 [Flavobacteriales bacterium]|nr:hypothetical protein [Flavobacteriales bacterium]
MKKSFVIASAIAVHFGFTLVLLVQYSTYTCVRMKLRWSAACGLRVQNRIRR